MTLLTEAWASPELSRVLPVRVMRTLVVPLGPDRVQLQFPPAVERNPPNVLVPVELPS